ncbi:MAG: serine/threonine-protein kinase [Myxococcota bacterium]
MTTPDDERRAPTDREPEDSAESQPDSADAARAELFADDTLDRNVLHADVLSRMFGEVDEEVVQTLGRYEIERELGEGGMGVVYLAYDPELDRKVALKLLRRRVGEGDDDETEHRLRQEARAMARLRHTHVVNVHDVGLHRERLFLAMEYVPGQTLGRWLSQQAPRPWTEIVRVFVDAGRGLAAAHAADMVHRDFKPDNVLIDDDGVVKVTDFGIAVAMEGDEYAGTARAGTPRYMSPEQLRGKTVDPRSDQFSFCIALYEALLGQHPFAGDEREGSAAAILKGQLQTPPARHTVPGWVLDAVTRGLSARPDERWPTMEALLHTLQRDPAVRRRRILAGGAAVLGASVLAFTMGRTAALDAVDPCDDGREKSAAVWDPTQRDTLREHFGAQSEAFGASSFDAAAKSMDAWATSWGDAYTALCRSRHERTDEGYEQRMTCLDRQRREAEDLVALLGEADASVVAEAPQLTRNLPFTRECTEGPLDPSQPPAEIADEVEQIRRELATLDVYRRAHQVEDHPERLAELSDRAEALGYPRLVTEVRISRARDHLLRRDHDPAQELMQDAYGASLEQGDLHMTMEVALVLLRMVPANRTDENEHRREEWNRTALHLSKHFEQPVGAELERRRQYLDLLRRHGRGQQMRTELEDAFDFIARTIGQGTPHEIDFLLEKSRQRFQTMELDEALAAVRQARQLTREWVGPTHPENVIVLYLEAQVLEAQGHHEESLRALREGFAVVEATPFFPIFRRQFLGMIAQIEDMLGDHAEARAAYEKLLGAPVPEAETLDRTGIESANSLCFVLYNMGEYEQAQAVCEQALAACDVLVENEKPLEAVLLNNLALIARAQGRMDDSLAYDQRALAICESFGLPNLRTTVYSWIGIGESYLGLGQPELALDSLKKAFELRRDGKVLPAELGEAECLLAQATWATKPKERDDALRMATEGLQRMHAAGPAWTRQAAMCQTWLEQHGGSPAPTAP